MPTGYLIYVQRKTGRAGTGKLTRQLAARGLTVIAVEPSDGMREQLHAVLPEVRACCGRMDGSA